MVSREIEHHNSNNTFPRIDEILVHTGQHYDHNMSQIFFDQMNLPQPKYNLGIGSRSHAQMTAGMLIKIEKVLMEEKPDWVLVYGDTNSTIAGALAATKLQIPVGHVEAGLRSYNRRMPEEINRILTDRISHILFCPTASAVEILKREGLVRGVFNVGDVMYDAFLAYKDQALIQSAVMDDLGLKPKNFCLVTVHRQENTDDPSRLSGIFSAFNELAEEKCPFVIPLHPRTRKVIRNQILHLEKNPWVHIISPVSYLDMLALESQARIIFTDSGGMQKEALFARVPCITLRDETEWNETVAAGWNHLAGAEKKSIIEIFHEVKNSAREDPPNFFGDGNSRNLIVKHLSSATPIDFKTGNSLSQSEKFRDLHHE
jgi:UDP-GlcNAc3NAcA epimerase